MKQFIYADNAATTKLDIDAFEAMKPYLLEEYGNVSQPYSFSCSGKNALKMARVVIAECIGADPEEIYFTSGGTESDNWAIKGNILRADLRVTITSAIEHHAILNACASVEKFGYPVIYLPVNGKGEVLPKTLNDTITDDTKLVSIMMANNEIGTIQPIKDLCLIVHKHGALFHTDAVQAVGHIPVAVHDIGIDMLSASGHKFNAPKGVGFLYLKKGIKLRPYADGGSQEFGLRAGTENIASIIAMSVALKKNCEHMKTNAEKLRRMEIDFFNVLSNSGVDFIRNGNGQSIPGNINISIKNCDGEMLLHRLDLMGICISTGSACDSSNTRISHVITAIGVSDEYAKGTIRITFGVNNNENDAEIVARSIIRILEL